MAGTSEECQGLGHLNAQLKVVSSAVVEIFADLLLPIPYFHRPIFPSESSEEAAIGRAPWPWPWLALVVKNVSAWVI
jgi:hypothetical protein